MGRESGEKAAMTPDDDVVYDDDYDGEGEE